MSSFSIADVRNGLPSLIDRAAAGDQVIITRHGHPVAELRPIARPAPSAPTNYSWLKRQRAGRKSVTVTSIKLLRSLYDDEG